MLQVARLSPKLLGDSTQLVGDFLLGQLHPDGGFRDRQGKSDLYYTTFGIAGLMALQIPLPTAALSEFLRSFGDGGQLSLVDLACLARCWAALPTDLHPDRLGPRILEHLESYRTADGGYHAARDAPRGTLYGCFLALGAAQDLRLALPDSRRLIPCINQLRARDGGYANSLDIPWGLTPPTAAAVALMRHLGQPPPDGVKQWLLSRWFPEGGFCAGEGAVMPDLLSTATALHALDSLHVDLRPLREPCLDFLDTLWTARGGFHGTWEDNCLDCEYTYYGLLALGHLSL